MGVSWSAMIGGKQRLASDPISIPADHRRFSRNVEEQTCKMMARKSYERQLAREFIIQEDNAQAICPKAFPKLESATA